MIWLASFASLHWKGLAAVALASVLLLTGYRWAYGRGEAHVEARWAIQRQADAKVAADAQAAADATLARQTQATLDAARLFTEKQNENMLLADRNRALADRLRVAIARDRDRVPAPGAPASNPEPASGGELSVPVGVVAAGLLDFSTACARSRDDLAAQVNGLISAWPR